MTVVVRVRVPLVPVMGSTREPVAAVAVVATVSVDEAAVAGFGLKDAVTPPGRPEADKLMLLVKPLCGVTVTLLVLLDP